MMVLSQFYLIVINFFREAQYVSEMFTGRPIETNCYILADGNKAIIIDPGWDSDSILKVIESEN